MQYLYERELPPLGITSSYSNGILKRIQNSLDLREQVGSDLGGILRDVETFPKRVLSVRIDE